MFRIEPYHPKKRRTHNRDPTTIASGLKGGEGAEDREEENTSEDSGQGRQNRARPRTAEARQSGPMLCVGRGLNGEALGGQGHCGRISGIVGGPGGSGQGRRGPPRARISRTRGCNPVGVATEFDAGSGSDYLRARLLCWIEGIGAIAVFAESRNQGLFGVVLGRRARRASVHWKRPSPAVLIQHAARRGAIGKGNWWSQTDSLRAAGS
jgi:hypothetical protein